MFMNRVGRLSFVINSGSMAMLADAFNSYVGQIMPLSPLVVPLSFNRK